MSEGSDLVSINFVMPEYLQRFRKGYQRLLLAIASDIQTNRALLFDAEGAFNGRSKWKDLASGLNKKKNASGLQVRQILRKSGALKNSIAPRSASGKAGPKGYVGYSGDMKAPVVSVGTNIAYARIHDQGGVINHPGTNKGFGIAGDDGFGNFHQKKYKKRGRKTFLGRGLKIRAHRIKIPQRQFSDWNYADMANMKKVIKNTLQEIINGR